MDALSHPLCTCLKNLQQDFDQMMLEVTTAEQLEVLRIHFLGRNGTIAVYTQELKALSAEYRKLLGPILQHTKQAISLALDNKKDSFRSNNDNEPLSYDVTTPLAGIKKGSLHPITHLSIRMQEIFSSMGYRLVQGPELETEHYNFEALNIPQSHPARDLADTLWIDNTPFLLRTHTSTVQVRTMQQQSPPLAIAAIGRVYRHEATDATHDYMFHQVEGLLIDKDISMKHLLGMLTLFFRSLFESDQLKIRIRPSYFPFVKPGIEVDVTCPFCSKGCNVCKKTGWIEMGGAGLVHHHVLHACQIDSTQYSGFAFGFGVSRIAMLKYGINDVRYLTSNRLDFLMQF